MTHDFVKPKKTGGLDTNTHAGQRSPFASRPFLATPRSQPQPQDIQTMRERGARYQAANPHLYGTPAQPQTVQRQTSETEEESLQMKANESVQKNVEQPDVQTLIRQRAARVDTPLQRMMKVQMAEAQSLEQQEDEKLQTKSEATVQREIMPEVEEENLQMQSEPTLQREELPEEEEDKNLQMQSEANVQLKSQDSEQEQPGVQTKLTIGQPGDKYEQEADNIAAKVMSMPEPTPQNVQRQEIREEEETLQEKPLVDGITPVVQRQISETQQQDGGSQGLESKLAGEKGGGHPLSEEVRGFMEPRFGADFSDVRMHTGSAAVQMNQQLGAQAFTHGNDIYYGKGKAPGNDALTAHELAHTIQQISRQIRLKSNEEKDVDTYWEWWRQTKTQESYERLRPELKQKGYRFIKYVFNPQTGEKEKNGKPKTETLAKEVTWHIVTPQGKWLWLTTNKINSKCRQLAGEKDTSKEEKNQEDSNNNIPDELYSHNFDDLYDLYNFKIKGEQENFLEPKEILNLALTVVDYYSSKAEVAIKEVQKQQKYIGYYNNKFKLYSQKFFGNQYIPPETVKFQKAVLKGAGKVLKVTGGATSTLGTGLSIYDYHKGEIGVAELGADFIATTVSFIKPYGYVISTVYFLAKFAYKKAKPIVKDFLEETLEEPDGILLKKAFIEEDPWAIDEFFRRLVGVPIQ